MEISVRFIRQRSFLVIVFNNITFGIVIFTTPKDIVTIKKTRVPRATRRSPEWQSHCGMQMLCNIFPILSWQLLKRSSFKQFLILKKNIYGMPVNGAWSFEQILNGGQLGFTISMILVSFDLRITPMFPTKFRVNWPFVYRVKEVVSVKYLNVRSLNSEVYTQNK